MEGIPVRLGMFNDWSTLKTVLTQTNYRLQGESVKSREQQDVLKFFKSLIESMDEAMKPLNPEQPGGSFSDQKICKCRPHWYVFHYFFQILIKSYPKLALFFLFMVLTTNAFCWPSFLSCMLKFNMAGWMKSSSKQQQMCS